MASRVVDVVDPSSEGEQIASALGEAGIPVRRRTVEQLIDGTDAALVVLAGDADESAQVLHLLRQRRGTATAPVVLVGTPRGGPSEPDALVELGADAVYDRPVEVRRLLRKVETYLSPPEQRLHAPQGSGPPVSFDGSAPTPLEPTMQLEPPGEASSGWAEADAEPDPPDPSEPAAPPQHEPPPPQLAGIELGGHLHKMLADADRRIFPNEAPLDLRFREGEETPEQLVPEELLDSLSVASEPLEEDPLDAFTFIGAAPQHDDGGRPAAHGSAGGSGVGFAGDAEPPVTSAARARVLTTATPSSRSTPAGRTGGRDGAAVTVDALDVGEPTRDGVGRRGEVGEGGALALLWRLADHCADAEVQLRWPEGRAAVLTLVGGEPCALEGPVASTVLAGLRAEGRVTEQVDDEQRALAILERRIRAGLLGRYEVDRRLRRAREGLMHDLVDAPSLRFELRPLEEPASVPGPERAALFGSSLVPVLVEGARRRLEAPRVRRLVAGGEQGEVELRLGDRPHQRFRQAELEPELVELIERHEGRTLSTLLGEAAAEEGVAGAVYAMVVVGALRVRPAAQTTPGVDAPVEAIRRAVRAARVLAYEGDYFSILGVPRDARAREVRAAYEQRRNELAALPLAAHGLHALEDARRVALDAVDEAYDVLRDERLRRAYRVAIG